jgi:hypothetical protein
MWHSSSQELASVFPSWRMISTIATAAMMLQQKQDGNGITSLHMLEINQRQTI